MKRGCVVCSYCRFENVIHCRKYVYRCAALLTIIFPVFICRSVCWYEFSATITRPHFFTLFTNAIEPIVTVCFSFGDIAATAFAYFIIFFESVIYGLFDGIAFAGFKKFFHFFMFLVAPVGNILYVPTGIF